MSLRTLFIGLDGATFSVLDPLMDQGHMPFLRSFFRAGARAGMRTIVPPLTPPAWTSLMTGRRPGQHGVFDFFHMDPATRHIRFFTSGDVQCATIWSEAAGQGLRVTALNFPAMFPPPRVNGSVVPGWVPWRQLRLACWPEDLFARLKDVPGFNPRELAMDIKLEERATEGCADYAEFIPWIELHMRRERNWVQILRYLTQENPSELTGILFDGVDKIQHLCWRFLRPEDGPPLVTTEELRVRARCLDYFRHLDGLLEEICALAGPRATVLIGSDHGFGPTDAVLHINAWLEQHGYLAWSEAAADWDTGGALHGVSYVARHTWMLDWERTRVFAATPTANGLYIVGVPEAEYECFRRKLMADLRTIRHPASGEPLVEQIWTREEAFSGPFAHLGPDLSLILRDGGIFSILPSREAVHLRPEIGGQHRPLGVFGARGPGIRPNLEANEISILDVAPMILHSLGLPIPREIEGRVPEEMLAPGYQAPRRKDSAALPGALPEHPAGTSVEDEQAVLAHLRDLGYIE